MDQPDEWQVHPEYYGEVYDAITGVQLDATLIAKGRAQEMEFLQGLGAYKNDTIENCKAANGKLPVPTG